MRQHTLKQLTGRWPHVNVPNLVHAKHTLALCSLFQHGRVSGQQVLRDHALANCWGVPCVAVLGWGTGNQASMCEDPVLLGSSPPISGRPHCRVQRTPHGGNQAISGGMTCDTCNWWKPAGRQSEINPSSGDHLSGRAWHEV
eukprot:8401600-Pyramimonas_sp.AAC.1